MLLNLLQRETDHKVKFIFYYYCSDFLTYSSNTTKRDGSSLRDFWNDIKKGDLLTKLSLISSRTIGETDLKEKKKPKIEIFYMHKKHTNVAYY